MLHFIIDIGTFIYVDFVHCSMVMLQCDIHKGYLWLTIGYLFQDKNSWNIKE